MPLFGSDSLMKLKSCHPELQALFYEVIKHFDCKVLEGYRNEEDQNKAFADGNSKLKFPYGKHNSIPSNAIDVSPYPIVWNDTKRFYWFAGFVMGIASQLKSSGVMKHDLRYGGDWNSDKDINDQKFNDLVHFELVI